MEKINYLKDIYKKSHDLNIRVIMKLYDYNFKGKYKKVLERLLEMEEIVYSEVGRAYIERLTEDNKNIDKVIAKLEANMKELNGIEAEISNENKFTLN